jgi:uncharacterized protein (DUF1778 family)
MTLRQNTTAKTTSINIRTSQHDLDVIDRAATIAGKSRTEFMLESSRQEAEHVLLDRTFFIVDEATYGAFVAQLDNPAPSTGALRKLLQTPAPWE